MKATAVGLLALLFPLQAGAQSVELTLNCDYETASDMNAHDADGKPVFPAAVKSSGSFSAIVRLADDTATIEATTSGCYHFVGSFSELSVGGECENTVNSGSMTIHDWLDIDRVSGAFELKTLMSTRPNKPPVSFVWYYGHCKPGKKIF